MRFQDGLVELLDKHHASMEDIKIMMHAFDSLPLEEEKDDTPWLDYNASIERQIATEERREFRNNPFGGGGR